MRTTSATTIRPLPDSLPGWIAFCVPSALRASPSAEAPPPTSRQRQNGRATRVRRQQGSQLVELALTLPLLLFILLVIGEGAAALRVHQVISNAAREGARISSLPENKGDTTDVQQQVIAYAGHEGVSLTTAQISVSQNETIPTGTGGCTVTSPCLSASRVEVDDSYPLQYLPRLTWVGIPGTLSLRAAAEFRNFY